MGTFTIEKLRATQRLIESLPPPPFFASSKMLFADCALMFEHSNRRYVGAHPDFWAKIPQRGAEVRNNPLADITVWNIDVDRSKAAIFFAAYAAFIGAPPPDSQDSA